MTQPSKQIAGNPASAQPMRNLSERAKKQIAPRSAHYRETIEPAGSWVARQSMKKAKI